MSPRVEILGIRHHGPGSARSVRRALDEIAPSAVVIEGPPELDALVGLAGDVGLTPPVAGLVYDVAEPRHASFYPLAVFSPEWVALQWAIRAGAEVRFGDLPATNRLALERARQPDLVDPNAGAIGSDDAVRSDADADAHDPAEPSPTIPDEQLDPIGALAAAAGYDDAERWWEDAIEQRSDGGGVLARFHAVRDAMATFRDGVDDAALERDLLQQREASMRKVLRSVTKQSAGPVVVVCGAFHAPVLHPDEWPAATADNALLKGLPKTKVAATWAPWTSGRLTYASGYGAGVTAPRWYEHLFTHDGHVVSRWMVDAARLLREEGHAASAASAVEATRLAEALASLRGRPNAGLAEVSDAAETVLAQGSALVMSSIAKRLRVGSTLGTVPAHTPMVPLAQDLERQIKSLRMKKTAERKPVVLDLRKDNQLARSVLLRRLGVLGIPWGTEIDAGRTGGTFKEAWELEWQPEFAVAVIEASLHGTTVESAASARIAEVARHTETTLARLASLVETCLVADLHDGVAAVLDILSRRTATAPDQTALMGTVEPLARTRRYGDVRGVDTNRVHGVLATMVDRVAIGLSVACVSLDDDAAAEMQQAIRSVERGVALVGDDAMTEAWGDALAGLSPGGIHGAVGGTVARILLDGGRIDADEAARRLQRALSLAVSPAMAAAWLDGFLEGDVALLVHDPRVFSLVDSWLSDLDDEVFDDLLPLVRRTFARFHAAERREIGDVVSRGGVATAATGDEEIDLDRAGPALAKVASMLGLAPVGEVAS